MKTPAEKAVTRINRVLRQVEFRGLLRTLHTQLIVRPFRSRVEVDIQIVAKDAIGSGANVPDTCVHSRAHFKAAWVLKATDLEILGRISEALGSTLRHELFEGLWFKGRQPWNPHKETRC